MPELKVIDVAVLADVAPQGRGPLYSGLGRFRWVNQPVDLSRFGREFQPQL